MHPSYMTLDPAQNLQLFWDDQDPKQVGWTLRYWTLDGTEHNVSCEAAVDDGLEVLSEAAIAALDGLDLHGTCKIDVRPKHGRSGQIKISTESGISWKYD